MNTNDWFSSGFRFGLAVAILIPVSLTAQVLPGQPRPQDRLQVQQAQFRALMLERVNVVISAWQEAWNTDDAEAAANSYSEVGTLIMSGEQFKGRAQIEEHFREILPSIGHLSFSIGEFEASGSMAMMLGTFHYREEAAPNERTELLGNLLMVLVEENGSWKIRSQIFQPASPA
jgi:uncharacterized protein (TIGR02246 family)